MTDAKFTKVNLPEGFDEASLDEFRRENSRRPALQHHYPPIATGANPMTQAVESELDRMTNEIARRHGCDRGTFTVCWGEYERGEVCRCKEEAREALAKAASSQTDDPPHEVAAQGET